MKVLNELELRQSLLLKYRETIIGSNKMEDRWDVQHIDSALDWLLINIIEVKKNKLYFYDNPQYFDADLAFWDKEFAHAYEINK